MMKILLYTFFSLLITAGCKLYQGHSESELSKRQLKSASGKTMAIYYAATHQGEGVKPAVVIFEPYMLTLSAIDRKDKGGLIPFLNYHGYPVWLLRVKDFPGTSLESMGKVEAPDLLTRVKGISSQNNFILLGVSLGGQAVMHFLQTYIATGRPAIIIDRIAFLGTGFDYNYPGAFPAQGLAGSDREKLRSLCESSDPACNYFKNQKGQTVLNAVEYIPLLEKNPVTAFSFLKDLAGPVFFVQGSADSIAPSESVYPVYRMVGSGINPNPVAADIDKLYMTAGKINNIRVDYDHFRLFYHPRANEEIYPYMLDRFEGR